MQDKETLENAELCFLVVLFFAIYSEGNDNIFALLWGEGHDAHFNFFITFNLLQLFPAFFRQAGNPSEFFRLSNIKDALVEGDCTRFGGVRFDGDFAAMATTLSRRGAKRRGYNNVIDYRGRIYVLWSYRSGLITRRMEFCVFS